ncbi:MAG: PEP-CTERM sorting domain-containing protein [Planctomycetaceae bacterium]|nr:PEP-CTERM sorting domain-containing protein [Planctomycetaceae bacterium]
MTAKTVLTLGLVLCIAAAAQASVTTNYAYYRLGEDQGAVAGGNASAPQLANTDGTTFQDTLYTYLGGSGGTAVYSDDVKAGSGSTTSVLLNGWGGWANNIGGVWDTGTNPSIQAMSGGNWGMEVYVKSLGASFANDGRIYQNGRGPIGGQWSALQVSGNGSTFFREGDNKTPQWSASAIADQQWHSMVLVQRASDFGGDKFYVYYDGELVYSDNTLGQTSTPQSMFMLGGSDGAVWTGYLDEFRIFTFDASAANAQIVAETNQTIPEPATMSLLAIGALAGLIRRRKA